VAELGALGGTTRIVITWSQKEIAEFLRLTPSVEQTSFAGTQFTFEFPAGDLTARLVVYPHRYDVWVRLFSEGSEQEIAEWRLECDRIVFNDEIPEEGGPCLAFQARLPDDMAGRPRHPLHWLLISQRGDGFRVASYFLREHESIRVA